MDRRPSASTNKPVEQPRKIYIAMIGAAPMTSLDALILSLDRFKTMLTSDSARDQFSTTLRSVQASLLGVNAYIDAVYAEKHPNMVVTSKNYTLVVELTMTEKDLLECIHDHDTSEILSKVIAVGTLPPKKLPAQKIRDYKVFPIKFVNGKFVKF